MGTCGHKYDCKHVSQEESFEGEDAYINVGILIKAFIASNYCGVNIDSLLLKIESVYSSDSLESECELLVSIP